MPEPGFFSVSNEEMKEKFRSKVEGKYCTVLLHQQVFFFHAPFILSRSLPSCSLASICLFHLSGLFEKRV